MNVKIKGVKWENLSTQIKDSLVFLGKNENGLISYKEFSGTAMPNKNQYNLIIEAAKDDSQYLERKNIFHDIEVDEKDQYKLPYIKF